MVKRTTILSVLILLAVWLVFMWPALTLFPAQRMYVVEGDFTNQFYPFRHFTASEIYRFRPPLWNPYIFGGHPFQADPQTAVFYPLALLTAVAFGAGGLPVRALQLEMAGHYLLALLFAYAYFRLTTRREIAAVGGAICFGLSGFLTSYPAQQLPMLETAIWLPAVLLMLEVGIRRGATFRWAGLAAVPIALALLAGHSQTMLFIAYLAAFYAIYRLVEARLGIGRSLQFLLTWGLLSVGLSAIQLLPTFEFIGESTRQQLSYAEAAHGYQLASLVGLLSPAWLGEKALYLGGPALLAIASIAGRRRPPWFWLGVLLFSILLSLGGQGPIYPVLYSLAPGFALFKDQERAMSLAAFAGSALTAQWLAGLWDSKERLARKLAGPILLLLAVAGLLALVPSFAMATAGANPTPAQADILLAGALVTLTALIVVALWRWPAGAPVAATLVVAILFIDLMRVNFGNNLTYSHRNIVSQFRPIAEQLAGFPEPYRVFSEPATFFPPNYGSVLRLPVLTGDSPIQLSRVNDLLSDHSAGWKHWQIMNVKFHLSPGMELAGTEPEFASDGISLRRVVDSLPRVWAVRDYRLAGSPAEARRLIAEPSFHPGNYVVLEERPAGLDLVQPGPRPHTELVSSGPLRTVVKTSSNAPGLLVVSENYYPGWRAWMDGKSAPIYRADYVAMALFLPPGEHLFTLLYLPISLLAGLAISAISLAVIVALMVRHRKDE